MFWVRWATRDGSREAVSVAQVYKVTETTGSPTSQDMNVSEDGKPSAYADVKNVLEGLEDDGKPL